MAREEWRDREEPLRREARRDRRDFGQADYSADVAHDEDGRPDHPGPPRSWAERAGDLLSGHRTREPTRSPLARHWTFL